MFWQAGQLDLEASASYSSMTSTLGHADPVPKQQQTTKVAEKTSERSN